MSAIRLLVLIISSVWLACGSAHAEKRVALVIGNSAYRNVPQLPNPANDAALVGGMFKKAGFDFVEIKTDLNAIETRKALREFGGRARDAAVAVVYYAGHGIELDGTNYLIPTDARLETDTDVYDEAFPLDRLLVAVEPAKQLRLIILDACRDNPFANKMKRTLASRGIGRGLAKVEPTSPNTMVAYAAKAGSTASDGNAQNSPFAAALVERLPTPGLDLRKAFGFVRDDVLKTTGYQQEPYVYGSLGGDDVPLVPAKPVTTEPQANPDAEIRRDYELALQLGTRDGWAAFLNRFPSGFYADLAKGQLNKITAEETRAAAAQKARQAEEEKARLAADKAKKAEQEKAAAAAKAAEDARIAAEKAKAIEEARAAAAEQRRKDAEAKALADQQVVEKKSADGEQKVAALSTEPLLPALSPRETATLVQSELRRVGCLTANVDGDWNAASQRSLTLFNKYAGTKFDTKLASFDVLNAIKAKSARVCPLVCEHGFKADGDKCVTIACRAGYRVNDDNECEKPQEKKQVSTREETLKRDADRKSSESNPARAQTSGQMFCNQAGCRPVRSGCRLISNPLGGNAAGISGGMLEKCN